ncbi:MAG: DUF6171 family protein [bacterium]
MPCFCLFKRFQRRRLARRAEEWLKSPAPRIRVRTKNGNGSQTQGADRSNGRIPYRTKLKICGQCEQAKYLLGRLRCGVCGCFVEVKAAFPSLDCPLEKWQQAVDSE